ncbi:MAG: tripartite tricarboxylate transporter TctB family protein [Beijerinckiaceae bacterium]|nr:tripartite tricarboxylate transporter TctB family protein [Beijerinckiaceae bacterium]
MFIRAPKDFWAGLMFLAFAAVAIVTASSYSMGRGGRMGPGYFPSLLGWALAFLGVILLVRSLAFRGEAVERIQARALLVLVFSVLVFAVAIQPLGLVAALILTTFIAAFATPEARWLEAAALSAGLTALTCVIFVLVLRLPLPLWPTF